ncbi:MAG: hypothetical protein M1607_03115 [Patescibacteria group bacterium]|nr:hypothetical protein [Patescibacteria group bacterium]
MNFAYYRKSESDFATTVKNVKDQANQLQLNLLGETKLKQAVVIYLNDPDWVGNLLAIDMNLIGFLPSSVIILEKEGVVKVGIANPALLAGVSQNPAILQLSKQIADKFKTLVNQAAGCGPLKAKAVKLFSTTSCPYCKLEKAWLDSKQVKHEVIYVDLNPKAAEEMVQKTGQMGVPVTEIQFEDNNSEFVVGFDKNQLANLLGTS